MTPENFCYWLQGRFELTTGELEISTREAEIIESQLKLVFEKHPQAQILNPGIKIIEQIINNEDEKIDRGVTTTVSHAAEPINPNASPYNVRLHE